MITSKPEIIVRGKREEVMTQGIKEKDIRDFEKYAIKLESVLSRIREYKPEANAYLSEDVLYLMSDTHHNEHWQPNRKKIVSEIIMPGFDGGGW